VPPVVEEHIFFERGICGATGEVGLVERVAAHDVPIDSSIRFLDALAVAVVGVAGDGGDGDEVACGVRCSWILVGTGCSICAKHIKRI
jgi:hypothetical protein